MTNMVTWKEVVDVTTGRIYASCDDVERKTGVPSKLVDACIRANKPIDGHRFQLVERTAPGGCPQWVHAGESAAEKRARAKARSDGRAMPNSITTPEDRARAVKMYERGVKLSDISAALGRPVQMRDITRWNGGVTPERPEGFWNHGRGRGITINNNRPSWENDA